ncbi:hypothetical protein FOL47_000473 [Perkinsus chesapeaki]|uniref:Uncharacterized protein n=1 Tax=Perkinsus chesapeaki TaxID=330153 RepID=A0A7J6MLU8_PERCH|nr:hypothetical protein FOL47_000473 [Perkinsus chesapeaki]
MLELGNHQANCFTAIVQLLGLRKPRPQTKAALAVAEVPDAASPFYLPPMPARTPSTVVRGRNCQDIISRASSGACTINRMHVLPSSTRRLPPQSCLKEAVDQEVDIRSVSTDASLPSPRSSSLSPSLGSLTAIAENTTRRVNFKGVVHVIEFDPNEAVGVHKNTINSVTGLSSKVCLRTARRSHLKSLKRLSQTTAVLPRRAPQSTPTLFYDLNRPVDKLRNGVVLRPLNPHEIACLRRDRMMASAAIERKVRCVMATTSSPA